ncbi:MAG: nucleotide sugar dehydrogenase [Thaumarchaeota archaeon]|nr:nucleotide sugar dehydrogenase [Nitrososphaerota archaeon]
MEHETRPTPILYANDIRARLRTGRFRVCVVGIGRIGLPTALSFARSGIKVTGLDINESLISKIRSSDFPLDDEPGCRDIFESVYPRGMLSVTDDPAEAIPNADMVLLSLPTPMDAFGNPHYTALESVASQLNSLLALGSVVVVESTVEPNFVESEMAPLIEGDSSRLKVSENFGLGVCPETANPGQILDDFGSLPRLVGAMDERTAEIISEVYGHVFPVELVRMPDCRTANAVKLTTNVFRDVNIAFVNELAILFERLGIDVNIVLEAAKRKYNFEPHYPGAGVGGPCLPVNSYQMLNVASRIAGGSSLLGMVRAGRRANEFMPSHVVDLLYDGLREAGSTDGALTVALLGVSYKPNVRDVQLAPSGEIARLLRSRNVDIKIYDPHYAGDMVFGARVGGSAAEIMRGVDAAVLVTAHDELRVLEARAIRESGCRVIVDCCGAIDPAAAVTAGLVYRGVGRGAGSTDAGGDDVGAHSS